MLRTLNAAAATCAQGSLGRVLRCLRLLVSERRGNVAILVGLSMPVIIGGSGLSMDVATWYHARKETQVAADSAAYAAALNLAEQGLSQVASKGPMELRATDAAGRNGYNGTVTLNYPPTSGIAVGNTRAVEAVLSAPADLFFTNVFWGSQLDITARAVAMAVVSDACVWALNPTMKAALSIVGGAQVDLGCGVIVNSNHEAAALDQGGTSCLNATSIAVTGGPNGNCLNPQAEKFLASYGDPLSALVFPSASDIGPCDFTTKLNLSGGTVTLYPGTYCGDISISGATVTFATGLYYLNGADLKISGNSTVSSAAGGVTFFLTGGGGNFAEVDIASGANLTLEARTVDPYANMLFYQDPNAPSNSKNKFLGGSTQSLTGIIYYPATSVEFSGGSIANKSKVAIVADSVVFSGSSVVDGTFASSLLPEQTFARLVE